MFKFKNLYIVGCLLALTIYAAPAWASICFAPSGGCVDALGGDVDSRDTQGSLNECIGFTLYEPEEGDGWNCTSCTQTSGTTLYKCKKNTCGSEFDIKKYGEEPPKALPGWECESCMKGYEQFWYCPKHYCAPKYGEKKTSASAAKFSCEGANPDTCPHGDDILYNCECDDNHKERPINGVASCVRICKAEEHREYNPLTDKCECETYYKEKNGSCVHEDYSAECQALLNNLYAVSYSSLSSSECSSLKIRLGIKKCLSGSDYWAGAVKTCGGVDKMPTSDELTKLAQCMYNTSSLNTSVYGKRNDSYFEELGLSTEDNVFVWQEYQNKNNTKTTVRKFAKTESIPYWAERDGSKYYTGNGDTPTAWENNSILSQTLCRHGDEDPCKDCEYCIQSTCKSSGEKRIISDSSTYEKCSDSCGGKYRCRSGFTPEYVGSNQYKCVSTATDPCEDYTFDQEYCDGYGDSCCSKCNDSKSANYGKYKCIMGTCKAPRVCESNTCSSDFDLDYIPLQGNCSKCSTGNKAKCEGGAVPTVFGISGRSVCYNSSHPCEMMNYGSCEYNQVSPSKYIDLNESCPSGAPKKIGPITPFKSSEFIGTPFYTMQCYHCEKDSSDTGAGTGGNSSGNSCPYSTYTATISCRLVNTVQSDSGCPGQTGVGIFSCDFDVPSCAFSKAGVYDSSGNVLYSYGAGTGSVTVPSCKLNGTCKFFVSGNTLKGSTSLTSNGNGVWGCSYTKGAGQN